MDPKTPTFDVALKSTERQWVQKIPEVYTNDLHSVSLQFRITDCTDAELTGSTAIVLLKMRDGSFFQGPSVDVTRTLNVFSYTLKENEGNHDGLAEIQLIVTIGAKEFATQKYNFKVITGLDSEVAREIMIHDWTTLTREARAYIDEFAANEILREAEFDNNEFDRNAAFNLAQTNRQNQFSDLAEDLTATLAAADANIEEFDVALETGIAAAKLAEKLEDFEEINNSRLLSTERQLAETVIIADTAAIKADAMASGSPKGVYATLALLQAAYPTGTTGAYLVTADGKWYYWSGSAWVSGGTYQSTGIVDGSVPIRKLNFKIPTNNLFDFEGITLGFLLSSGDGSLVANATYYVSDWINVEGIMQAVCSSYLYRVAFYDINKAFLSVQNGINPSSPINIPDNAFYIRTSAKSTTINAQTVLCAGTVLIPWIPPYHVSQDYLPDPIAVPLYPTIAMPNKIDVIKNKKLELFDYGMINYQGYKKQDFWLELWADSFNVRHTNNRILYDFAGASVGLKNYIVELKDILVGGNHDQKDVVFNVVQAPSNPLTAKNILFVGDSITAYGYLVQEFKRMLSSADADAYNLTNYNLVGRLTSPLGDKYEAQGGYSWTDYAYSSNPTNGAHVNPFWDTGVSALNFTKYMTDNCGGASLDYVVIPLGVNNFHEGGNYATFTYIQASIEIFLNALHTQYPNCKVLLVGQHKMPSIVYDFVKQSEIDKANWITQCSALYETIAIDADYSSFVHYVNVHARFDSDNNAIMSSESVNLRSAETAEYASDYVHPQRSVSGMGQYADAILAGFFAIA